MLNAEHLQKKREMIDKNFAICCEMVKKAEIIGKLAKR